MLTKILNKTSLKQLGEYLNAREISCNCELDECLYTLICPELITRFDKLRFEVNSPIRITSGFRCKEWNKICGGVSHSKHQVGAAIDMKPPIDMPLNQFAKAAWGIFDKVIMYKHGDFIHCSIDIFKEDIK